MISEQIFGGKMCKNVSFCVENIYCEAKIYELPCTKYELKTNTISRQNLASTAIL